MHVEILLRVIHDLQHKIMQLEAALEEEVKKNSDKPSESQ